MTAARNIFLGLWLVLIGLVRVSAAIFHTPENRIRDFSSIRECNRDATQLAKDAEIAGPLYVQSKDR